MMRAWLWMLVLAAGAAQAEDKAAISFGETWTIASKVLGETRRINVYAPPSYDAAPGAARPVLYMPDGGMAEDFLHVAGLLQVSVANGTMRPFLLVGIENTQRRRDLTGPTENARDKAIAPVVGGSAAFRAFLRTELMPQVAARYRITGERAIMGESLAGLFVVETYLLEPALFDTYIAFDPSLWWNERQMLDGAPALLTAQAQARAGKRLYVTGSGEPGMAPLTQALAAALATAGSGGWQVQTLAAETHATVFHPAALQALRTLFKGAPSP